MYNGNDIQGWCSLSELQHLYDLSTSMDSIVEIGCWKGRSTHALVSGCKGKVWAVDHFQGSPEERRSNHQEATQRDISGDITSNLRWFPNLTVLNMTSQDASMMFPDRSVDMVYIDGGHSSREVRLDLYLWTPKAKKVICGHDYQVDPRVRAEVNAKYGVGNVTGVPTEYGLWVYRIPGALDGTPNHGSFVYNLRR